MDDGLTPKLQWRIARVVDSEPETASAQTIGLAVPGWRGHVAGQHIDLKLTAEDGYSAQRSYSLSRPAGGERIPDPVRLVPVCQRERDRAAVMTREPHHRRHVEPTGSPPDVLDPSEAREEPHDRVEDAVRHDAIERGDLASERDGHDGSVAPTADRPSTLVA